MAFSPPEDRRSLSALTQIMANLRAPNGGCPWDLEQDHRSIARYTIEEAYEVVDAIEQGDDQDLRDELGDLLLQVIFHSQMASERGAFTLSDVIESIVDKMVRRHPHVFADADHRNADEQTAAWEDIKAAERAGKDKLQGALADIPVGMPALTRAEKLGKRAARMGFDWPDVSGVTDKIREELAETEEAIRTGDESKVVDELGDLLFSVANLTRYLGVDGETALRGTNAKFMRRFAAIEDGVARSGRRFEDHTLAELESYWDAAKRAE
ncbi:nucleoside triphosphate pyrophosphohydrolase [Parvularcula sp. LCG005]|uniref:nucleoside triphosphate pyrophosphohydrolase n=1 Tax=Parvularcula sp. LCG005 TaxID=3078805 RepID=UPI002942A4CC|nr:nucleoside triphosphate pyrophosphohydrolase [Parvularcula sp. LCG005]WOI52135.1 nucleoside triphosphate pyrophosphohydrolase [Parvularcula sp. LCG005]